MLIEAGHLPTMSLTLFARAYDWTSFAHCGFLFYLGHISWMGSLDFPRWVSTATILPESVKIMNKRNYGELFVHVLHFLLSRGNKPSKERIGCEGPIR